VFDVCDCIRKPFEKVGIAAPEGADEFVEKTATLSTSERNESYGRLSPECNLDCELLSEFNVQDR
jgi:hypothetical protein